METGHSNYNLSRRLFHIGIILLLLGQSGRFSVAGVDPVVALQAGQPLQGSLNTYNITDIIAPKTISEIITFGDVIKSYADVINDNVFVNASPGSYN